MPEDAAPRLRVVERQEGTAGDFIDEYLKTLSGKSASTVEAYGRTSASLPHGSLSDPEETEGSGRSF